MYLQIGSIEQVTVLRETEIGYMVGNEEEEIFLHKNEVAGEIEEGDTIDVFLYLDRPKSYFSNNEGANYYNV